MIIFNYNKKTVSNETVFFGDPCENRTRDTAVKGRCLNRLTNGPFIYINSQSKVFIKW